MRKCVRDDREQRGSQSPCLVQTDHWAQNTREAASQPRVHHQKLMEEGLREGIDRLDEGTNHPPTRAPREILPEKVRKANPLVISRICLKLTEIFPQTSPWTG